MRKLLVILSALLLFLTNGCTAVSGLPFLIPMPTSTPQISKTSTPSPAAAPILVPHFYDSDGLQIYVGQYSEQLRTNDPQELTALAQEMKQQRDTLRPEQMFVLAIRLYDLGQKNSSVYWFYEGQFRAKLLLKTVDTADTANAKELSTGLLKSYDEFTVLEGKYINGYAGCDVDNWAKIAETVKDDNPTPPDLHKLFPEAVLVERSQWQRINDEVGAGLGVLVDQLLKQKQAILQDRQAKNLDALYCG